MIHDALWSDCVLSPRKRVMKSIQDSAQKVIDDYDDFFMHSPAKNIDDECEF